MSRQRDLGSLTTRVRSGIGAGICLALCACGFPAGSGKNPLPALQVGENRIELSIPSYAGAQFAGAWRKRWIDAQGTVLVDENHAPSPIPVSLKFRIRRARLFQARLLRKLRKNVPMLAQASKTYSPELQILEDSLQWRVGFVDASGESAWEAIADESGRLLDLRSAGISFVDGSARIYPRGPRMSPLADVYLPALLGDGSLASKILKAQSAAGFSLEAPSSVFHFATNDPRFEGVQAFFYAQNFLGWLKERFGLELSTPIDIEVHSGGLEPPRNVAYYFRGTVHLGSGDGQTYRGIPLDPSVVYHETSHALIAALAGLPTEGEGGSLNEAFADFLAAHFLDRPYLGEASYLAGPYRRSLLTRVSLPERNGALYHDSLIVSGALWEIRDALGADQGARIALHALALLNPESRLEDIGPVIIRALSMNGPKNSDDEDRAKVLDILHSRGWL